MGCDIHVHIEMQAAGGVWTRAEDVVPNPWYDPGETYRGNTPETYDDWYHNRNYRLFGILAGVRADAEPIEHPIGLPDDVGQSVEYEYGDAWDWHTAHWYALSELENHRHRFHPDIHCQDFLDCIDKMRDLADEELDGDPNKIRMVFWFDN